MTENKELSDEKKCAIQGVSSSNEIFRIVEDAKNCFTIEKQIKEEITKGYFWNKKTKIFKKWVRVNKYGNCVTIGDFFNDNKTLIEYTNLEDAKKWLSDYKKYPIYYYC